jgi:UDP-N-acetylmuramate dehydrogenase
VRLAEHTTVRLGGPARAFIRATTEAELIEAVRAADTSGEPVLILGGGSNLVVADGGFDGTVIQVATRGVTRDGPGMLTVAAGERWDAVVARAIAGGLAGLECLSGIPGLAGATPIQNVGAYGQEVSQTITSVRVYDRLRREILFIPNVRCDFSYRTSLFKRGPGRYLVLGVTFALAEQPLSAPVRYAELAAALEVGIGDRVETARVRSAVLELRRRKGMVIDPADPDTRSVGSFFVNPVLDAAELAVVEKAARARYGDDIRVPRFEAADGVKVPAAWLIERAGFGKGFRLGDGARISSKHTLALVNPGAGTTADLIALARAIRDGVRDTFGVSLTPEPVLVGVAL